jgi:spore germination cell wall hydrolase CwlJ-like protein
MVTRRNEKDFHMKLGASIFACLFAILLFYLYFDAKYKRDKQVLIEIHEIKESVLEIKEIIVEQQDEIEDLKEKYELITVPEPIQYKPVDIFCLAKNIYHEAGIESDYGKLAVAQVTLNRVRTGRWGKTICDVVMARHQFSWANKHSIRWQHPRGPLWQKSKEMANRILKRGLELKNFQHALYYHADYVNPNWASKRYIIDKIDTHIFYTKAL